MNIRKTILAAGVALAAFSSQKASAFNCPRNVVPVSGVYHVEVIFNTLKPAEVYLTKPDGFAEFIATKDQTSHHGHKVGFAVLNCSEAYRTGALSINVHTPIDNKPMDTVATGNRFTNGSKYWEQVVHTDAHHGNPIYEWRFHDNNTSSDSRELDIDPLPK